MNRTLPTLKFADAVCVTRMFCAACRKSADWRAKQPRNFVMPDGGIETCPYGVTADNLPGPPPTLDEAVGDAAAPDPVADVVQRVEGWGPAQAAWTAAARAMARWAKPGDAGLGDVAARLVEGGGGDTLAAAFTRLTGWDCGCADRQARLNQLFPFPPSS